MSMADGAAPRIHEYRHVSALGSWRVAMCAPGADLAPLLAAFWIGEGSVSYQRDRILPNGQSYLLINLGPPQYLVDASGQRRPFTDIWYSAQRQTPIETEAPHGQCLLGLALQPGASACLLDHPAHALTGQVLALSDLLGDGVLALRQRLLNTPTDADRFAVVENWLRRRRRTDAPALVGEALRRLQASSGQLEVAELARSLGISRQRLQRLFNQHVGLPAKTLARLQRFHSALALLRGRNRVPWVELAAHCGYFDQSHLIRDFRAFFGYAPGEFLRHAMPDAGSVVVA
jgi:AraC-like DNA-binding protein